MRIGRFIGNKIRLSLALVIGLALVGSLPVPAQAQDPVDLELGDEGATSWTIGNVMPGDSGNKTVSLHNAGYQNGFVLIWISDIVNGEGTNPEPETGDTAEPGELGDYLMFNLSGTGLSTNLSPPATINSLPQSVSDPNYIKVSPLNAGATVDLVWQWELPTQTGNEVQGDTLSFTINYLLQQFAPNTSTPSTAGRPTYGVGIIWLLKVDMLDEITWVGIMPDGTVYKSYVLTSPDQGCTMEIDHGTKLIWDYNKVPTEIVLTLASELPVAPDGTVIVSPLYEFTAYAYDGTCFPVEFDRPIRLDLSYPEEMLPDNTSAVFVAYHDGQSWIELSPQAYSVTDGKVIAETSHLLPLVSVMARLASPPAPTQPSAPPETPPSTPLPVELTEFQISDLAFNPDPAQPDQPVIISVTVRNTGSTSGSIRLELRIGGELFTTAKELILAVGESETVTFEVPQLPVGTHQVQIGQLTDQLTVESLPTSPVKTPMLTKLAAIWTPPFALTVGMVVAILAMLIAWLLLRRRRKRRKTETMPTG